MSRYAKMCMAAVILGLVSSHGIAGSEAEVKTYLGETKPVGNGIICSWFTVDPAGKPLAIGVTFTEQALSGLSEAHTQYDLRLPPQASVTAFDHLTVDWQPHGHIPPGIYDLPHFDFHFYMITQAQRDEITLEGESLERARKAPPPEYLPPDYFAAPDGEERRMGAHWLDRTTPELHGQPFTHTFVYGFYNGQLIFFEPMVTKAYLQTKPNMSGFLKLPAAYHKRSYYPTKYAVRHDPARGKYYVALQGLTYR